MAYDEWFETAYKENLELLERVACSFMLKKLDCGMEIYARYAGQVSEEIQEAFVLLWEKRVRLWRHKNITGWLINTVRNRLMHLIRDHIYEAAHTALSADDENVPGEAILSRAGQELPEDALMMDGHIRTLERLLGRENAEIYYGCRVEGKSAREMARRFKISQSAVWTRLSRAQDILDQHQDEFL